MKTYADIIDLLNFEGPGLQDYVSPAELDQLLDGTLPIAGIADRYMEDLDCTNVVAVSTDKAQTRADLLAWIRWEIETAAEQRKQAVRDNLLDSLAAWAEEEDRIKNKIHSRKMGLIAEAQEAGNTKDAIARNLGISRPTLNQWLTEQDDRALFDQALYLLGRDANAEMQTSLFAALGIRDTRQQAAVVLSGIEGEHPEGLTPEQAEVLARAEKRAGELS
ncbi:hypothetical protein ACIQWN_29155 [Streptomyces vinaceus]|uniref:hypothetical protein n=1 Tax=Streptomyces vinaceus TaxID=1960 RepID=UPI00381AA30A